MKKTKSYLCTWCKVDGQSDDNPKASFRVSVTDLEGVILDTVFLCDNCCKRGATFDGKTIDAHD